MSFGRTLSTWTPLALVFLATTAAAAVSLATAPPSTASLSAGSPSTGPRMWHDAMPEPMVPAGDGNRRAAVTEVHRLLRLVTGPSTWTPVSALPVQVLEAPASVPGAPNLVDLYQDWTTHGTRQAVQSWVDTHPPTGSKQVSSGNASNGTILWSSVTDAFPTTGNRFSSRQVVFTVAPLTSGTVGIRVDVQVVWFPSRLPAELVPAGDTKVAATVFRRGSLSTDSIVVLAKATFTTPSIVKHLARRIDSLPLALPGTRHCPVDLGTDPQLRLVFSGRRGVPTIVVQDDPDGCGSVTFTRGKRPESPLTDDDLLREVEKLPGLDLSGTPSS
jgi:hypothetical protein